MSALIARGTVLAADTVIDLDGELLGKPVDAADARAMLHRLSGRTHQVHTGVALVFQSGRQSGSQPAWTPGDLAADDVATSTVAFRELEPSEIERYVASGEPSGKSGSYAIQGGAKGFVSRIEGDVDNVVGLPRAAVVRLLAALARRVASRP